ncbi:MAG: hypothetical protein A2W19_05305 [Spirochaetes bacterium RBG_16_49_21]|nr:MAG: hypothetical protein A2W19_05305 [Spirochaetes bacterium RBG_16_49_21]
MFKDLNGIISVCKNFSFRYALHAPLDDFNPTALAHLTEALEAEIVTFHDIYWEDEWFKLIDIFKPVKAKLCIENIGNVHSPLKFMRRYGLGRCLDLEHLQFEISGVFVDEFINVIKQSSHIHLTGYYSGSQFWHTHIHHSPEHGKFMLDLIKRAGYSGFVVSEARIEYQTYDEFKKLYDYYQHWKSLSKDALEL